MWLQLTLASLLTTSTQAFAPAPIRWGGLIARNLYLAPERSASLNKVEALPHKLTILDQPSGAPSELFPSFTATHDKSITWRETNLCVEASGTESGATIRLDRCTGGSTQRWNWLSVGREQRSQIQLQGTNQCLDVIDKEGGLTGAAIELRECEDKASEAWKIEAAMQLPTQSPPQHSAVVTSTRHILMSSIVLLISFSALFWRLQDKSGSSIKEGVQLWNMDRGGVSLTLPMVIQQIDSVASISPVAMALSPISLGNDVPREQGLVAKLQTLDMPKRLFKAEAVRVSRILMSAAAPRVTKDQSRGGLITIAPATDELHSATFVGPIHGLGDTNMGWADLAAQLHSQLPHIKFVLPNAPVAPVTLNGGMSMPSWYDITSLDDRAGQPCTGIDESRAAIQALIDEEVASGIPLDRIVVGGFSQGGAMALATGLQYPGRLAGICVMSGYLARAEGFTLAPEASDTPVAHFHGAIDPVVKIDWARESARLLKEMGCSDYELTEYPDLVHSASMEEMADVARWLTSRLPPLE